MLHVPVFATPGKYIKKLFRDQNIRDLYCHETDAITTTQSGKHYLAQQGKCKGHLRFPLPTQGSA